MNEKMKEELDDFRNWNPLVELLSERVKELDDKIELAEAVKEDALAYTNMYKAKIKELEKVIAMLIDFIPDGWEVPLGWTILVSQARKLIEKEKP